MGTWSPGPAATEGADTYTGDDGSDSADGLGGDDILFGAGGADTLVGGAGADFIEGGADADTMSGGTGDDIIFVDNAGDVVNENAGEGFDWIYASANYTLPANVENIRLIGTTPGLTAFGNAGSNTLYGHSAASPPIFGLLRGGAGDDFYVISNISTVCVENPGEGRDAVYSSITHQLENNIEDLVLTGSANINGLGNNGDNLLLGNAGNNTLVGGGGANLMIGGLGDDWYVVEQASDIIIENAGEGRDAIYATISFALPANVEDLILYDQFPATGTVATGNALDNVITGNNRSNTIDGGLGADTMQGMGGNDRYVVDNAGDVVVETGSNGTDTVESSVSFTLGANVENLTLTGISALVGLGNSSANVLTGNNAGSTLQGGAGNDTYVITSTLDGLVEAANEGRDTVRTSVDYALGVNFEDIVAVGSTAMTLTGNAAINTLYGNAAVTSLVGGAGDDLYVLGAGQNLVVEASGEGRDTVYTAFEFTLPDHVEDIAALGASGVILHGNGLNNLLVGGGGDDTLDGGAGADLMVGGLGHDLYVIDNTGDIIVESNIGARSDIEVSLSYYQLPNDNIENVWITNPSGTYVIGNAQNMYGGSGADTFSGGHMMQGGLGDDFYFVDDVTDQTVELPNQGQDTVYSSVDWIVRDYTEQCVLLEGSAAVVVRGNVENNLLVGNSNDNVISGNVGIDLLVGNGGADTFVFIFPTDGTDILVDFTPGVDHLSIAVNAFGGGLVAGGAAPFVAGSDPTSSGASFLYDTDNGWLYWDPDGSGVGVGPYLIAALSTVPALTASDFILGTG